VTRYDTGGNFSQVSVTTAVNGNPNQITGAGW
jgi:hypothetical protein